MTRNHTPLPGSIMRITVMRRNDRWDVREEGHPVPIVDLPRREDAMDYALCIAAKAQIAIVELRDQLGTLLSRQEFHRHSDGCGMSRVAIRLPAQLTLKTAAARTLPPGSGRAPLTARAS